MLAGGGGGPPVLAGGVEGTCAHGGRGGGTCARWGRGGGHLCSPTWTGGRPGAPGADRGAGAGLSRCAHAPQCGGAGGGEARGPHRIRLAPRSRVGPRPARHPQPTRPRPSGQQARAVCAACPQPVIPAPSGPGGRPLCSARPRSRAGSSILCPCDLGSRAGGRRKPRGRREGRTRAAGELGPGRKGCCGWWEGAGLPGAQGAPSAPAFLGSSFPPAASRAHTRDPHAQRGLQLRPAPGEHRVLSGRLEAGPLLPQQRGLGGNGTPVASLALLGPGGVGAWLPLQLGLRWQPPLSRQGQEEGRPLPASRLPTPPALPAPLLAPSSPHSSPLPSAVPLPACASHSFTPAGAAGHLGAGLGGCGAKGKLCRGTHSCLEPPEAPGNSLYAEASVLLGAQGFSQGPGTQQTTVLLPSGHSPFSRRKEHGHGLSGTSARTDPGGSGAPGQHCVGQGTKRSSCHPGRGSPFLPQESAPAPPSWPLPRVPPRNSWLAARLPQAGSWVSSSLRPRSTR